MRGPAYGRRAHRGRFNPYTAMRGPGQQYFRSQQFRPTFQPRHVVESYTTARGCQYNPPPPIVCPHPECKLPVRQLDRHIQMIHTRKSWGLQCPCGFSSSMLDTHLFKTHRARAHLAPRGEDINPFKVAIPGGYMAMEKCQFCNFLGFSLAHIERHQQVTHNNGTLPSYQLLPISVATPAIHNTAAVMTTVQCDQSSVSFPTPPAAAMEDDEMAEWSENTE